MDKEEIEEYALNLAGVLIQKAIQDTRRSEQAAERLKERSKRHKMKTKESISKSSVEIQTESDVIALEAELYKKDILISELQSKLLETQKELNELKSLSKSHIQVSNLESETPSIKNIQENFGSLYDFKSVFNPEEISPQNSNFKEFLNKTDNQKSPDFNKRSLFTAGLKMETTSYSEILDENSQEKLLEEKFAEITDFLDKSKREFEIMNNDVEEEEEKNEPEA